MIDDERERARKEIGDRLYDDWRAFEFRRRPADQRCWDCVWWEVENWRDELQVSEDRAAPENLTDVNGACRRHAPRVAPGELTEIENLVGLTAWAAEETANIEHDKDIDYAAEMDHRTIYSWPLTSGHDWCGEFKPSRVRLSDEELERFRALKAEYDALKPPKQEPVEGDAA